MRAASGNFARWCRVTDLMRLACETKGHDPKDIDPTGGDPFMGGPVAITCCDRCGKHLNLSDAAKEFNQQVADRRDQVAAAERDRHTLLPPRWWSRKTQRCSCGWSGHTFDIHRSAAGDLVAWSR